MFKEFDDLTVNRTPNIQEAAPGKESSIAWEQQSE